MVLLPRPPPYFLLDRIAGPAAAPAPAPDLSNLGTLTCAGTKGNEKEKKRRGGGERERESRQAAKAGWHLDIKTENVG